MDDTGRNGTGDVDRAPPHDLDAERSALGSALIDSEAARQVCDPQTLTAGDFYAGRHRAIFEAMLAVVNDGAAPDAVTVSDALKRLGLADVAGGPAYLADLINAVPTAYHVAYYAGIVARTAGLRRIIQAAGGMVSAAYGPAAEVAPIVRDAAASLQTVDRAEPLAADALGWDDGTPPVPREWLIEDYLPAGRVALFSGAGGAGKSRLALQLAAALAAGVPEHWLPDADALKAGELRRDRLTPDPDKAAPVVFASYEDEPDEARRRLRCLAAGSSATGHAGRGPLAYAHHEARGGRLHYLDLAGSGPIWGPAYATHVETRAGPLAPWDRVTKYAARVGARLLILDPLAGAFGSSENDRAAVREFVSAVDRWAREHGCAVLLISHPPKPAKEAKAAKYSGSTDWRNATRTVWVLGDCEEKGCTVGECAKDGKAGLVLTVDKASYAKAPHPVHVADCWRDSGGAWANIEPRKLADADGDELIGIGGV